MCGKSGGLTLYHVFLEIIAFSKAVFLMSFSNIFLFLFNFLFALLIKQSLLSFIYIYIYI